MSVLRHALLSATVLASFELLVQPAHAQQAPREQQQQRVFDFNIPAQDLGAALNELGQQAGITIAFPVDAVAGRRSSVLRGRFTPGEAARRLITGTSLRVTETGRGSLMLVRTEASSDPEQNGGDGDADQIVVTGFRAGLANARDVAHKASNHVDVLSADDVGKLPDTNIAEALRRLPSVYLIRDQGEGRYVSIRGVDPILNNVTMNGQTIAVSDTDGESGRAAPLDVLSSSALSRVEIHKVTLPDMDGQGIGGTVNIVTPSGYDHKGMYLNASLEAGYNDFGKDNRIFAGNLAFSDQFGANDEFAIFLSGEYWFKQYMSQQYTASSLWTNDSLPSHYYFPGSVVYAESVGKKERYGGSANFEYRPDNDAKMWLRYFFTQYNDYRDRPQITLTTAGTRGFNSTDEFYSQRYTASMETRSELQERPVQQLVLGGEHHFGDEWTVAAGLNYTTAKELNPYQRYFQSTGASTDAGAGQDPGITFALDDQGLARPIGFNTALSNGLTFMDPAFERITAFRGVTSNVLEKTYTGNLDLTWDGELAGHALQFRVGFKAILRDKSVDDTDYRYYPLETSYLLSSYPGLSQPFSTGRGEPFSIIPGFGGMTAPGRSGYEAYFNANPGNFYYDPVSSRANSMENDYWLDEDIYAGYLMGEYHITPRFSVIAGVRAERTESDISAMGFVNSVMTDPTIPEGRSRLGEVPFATSDIIDISRSHTYTNVLPALVVRWDVANDWLFRASVTTNIGRPDYTDIAPISQIVVSESYDSVNDRVDLDASVEIGNPNLKPYKSTNFDASLDYYFPDRSGSMSIGAFYKRVTNAIYSIENQFENYSFEGVAYDHYYEETVANSNPGHIQGVEISVQKDLNFLPAPFDGFGIYANAAFISSDIEINVPGRPDNHVPFFNQADRIYNLQAYYERDGFSARVAYSYQGDATSSSFGANPDNDNYRAPRESVDAQVSYTFNNGLKFSLTGANLNDQASVSYRNHDRFFVSSYERFGREFRFSVSKSW
ncbi:TonB-dependent receptor [Sphingomonas cannabina]|uniref:TonB-dependent receptor n=1 Tax=Sphingomonas cannabina TaxID=2899123 RepID=UPI001F34211B|nr:TonB-dependent receptor [Sphingomonas cannabina]UIJ46291.1 TonB-dependent receptor [Sphingomonas cannabina]